MTFHNLRPRYRLYIDAPLGDGYDVELSDKQSHYLVQVLRLREGNAVALFNGRDGEWKGELRRQGKRRFSAVCRLALGEQLDSPETPLLFAPIRGAMLDLIAQKATELGVTQLHPVVTRRTVIERINGERLTANAIEAAEQCGRLSVPSLHPLRDLPDALGAWPVDRTLFFCDEAGGAPHLSDAAGRLDTDTVAVLVGPEGGFDDEERSLLRSLPFVRPVSLGPRILRAETAAIAALTLLDAARRS